jgi:hypothetical protein
MRLAVRTLVIALAAGVATTPNQGASSAGQAHVVTSVCGRASVPGVINGEHKCLRPGQQCIRRFDRQYHRYGFHCHTGRLQIRWTALEIRPLHLPQLAPGAVCPRSSGKDLLPYFPTAYGKGPVYAALLPGSDGIVHYASGPQQAGWFYVNFAWLLHSAHVQPTLVRGRQLDGSNELRFGRGQKPARELRIPTWRTFPEPHWSWSPSYDRLRAPGCYALQADSRTFSTVIVFQAAP